MIGVNFLVTLLKKNFLILFIFNSLLTFAQVNIEVKTTKTSVLQNVPFQISVEVSGRNAKFIEVRDLDEHIKLKNIGNSSNYSWINGVVKSTVITTYLVVISKTGNYKIGPFVYKDGNTLYESNIIEINVANSGDSSAESDFVEYENANYILTLEVNKKTIYVNEPLIISVKLYAREQLKQLGYDQLKLPTNAWVENINQVDSYRGDVTINNRTYSEHELERKRVFLSDYGEFTIPPVVFNFNGISGHSNSWFSYLEPMSVHTKAMLIDVLPLPKTDKNFSGFVGTLSSITAELSKNSVKLNEPTQLTIKLFGDGNFHNLNNINYSIPKDYIDEYSTKSDTSLEDGKRIKKWEILLVPKKSGIYELIVDDFVYFDIEKKEYITIPEKKLILDISSESLAMNEELIFHTGNNIKENDKNIIREIIPDEIGFIKTSIGGKFNKNIYDIYLYIIIVIYLIIILSVIIILVKQAIDKSLLANSKEFQRRNAYRIYQTEINKTIKGINKLSDANKLLNDIYKCVERYFGNKFSIDSVDFTYIKVLEKIDFNEKINLDDKCKVMLKEFFDTISYARFANKDLNKIEILGMVDKINLVIKEIEVKPKCQT